MLMRTFWRGAKTDDEYRKVLKKRCIGIGFMMAAGVAALIAAAALMKTGKGENDDFLSGVYIGIGTGILVSGIIFLYRVRKMFKNPELLRQRRLKGSDERSVLLNQKALYLSGVFVIIGAYIALLAAGFFSMAVFWTIWTIVMAYFLIYWICRNILERLM